MIKYQTSDPTSGYEAVRVSGCRSQTGACYVRVQRGLRGDGGKLIKQIASPRIPLVAFEGKAAKALLADAGMPFYGDAYLELQANIRKLAKFPERTVITSPGWFGPGVYGYPDGTVSGSGGNEPPIVVYQPDRLTTRQEGQHSEWLAKVAEPLAGHPIAEFCMMVALASILLRPAEMPHNFGIELAGPAGTGKSTLVNATASMFGPVEDPDGSSVINMNATANAIDKIMASYNDRPMHFEEWNLFRFQLMRNASTASLVTSLSGGHTKRRLGDTAPSLARFTWLTSTNLPWFEEDHRLAHEEAQSIADRLMTVMIDDLEHGGVYDVEKLGDDTIASLSAKVANAAREHHGTAYRTFVDYLTERHAADPEFLRMEIAKKKRWLSRMAERRELFASERLSAAMGLVFAAGMLGIKSGALPTAFDPRESVLHMLQQQLECRKAMRAPIEFLRDIVSAPDVLDVRRNDRWLTNQDLLRCRGILRKSRSGPELVLTDRHLRALPISSKRLFGDPDVKKISKAEAGRNQVNRKLVHGEDKMRVYAFELDQLIGD